MIKFNGTISDICKSYLLKKQTKASIIAATITTFILVVPSIILLVIWEELLIFFLPFIVCGCVLGICLALPITNPQTKNIEQNIPLTINIKDMEIEKNGIGTNSYATRKLEDIKKVLDFGEWYIIVFYFPHKNNYFICQKNLLVEGSIEDFEELFQGKIVRKNNTKS